MRNKVDLPNNSTSLKSRQKNIVFIHSLIPLIEVFNRLTREIIGDLTTLHILDEPLLKKVQDQGGFFQDDYERPQSHVHFAELTNAALVIVTCSTFSPAVEVIRKNAVIPVLKIDEFMISRAVDKSSRIGVIATAKSTIQPTEESLQKYAVQKAKKIFIKTTLVENALTLLLNGNGFEHDQLVESAIHELSRDVDLIILAQASLARVMDSLPKDSINIPVLSSPFLVLEQAREILNKQLNTTRSRNHG
jgi:Asp/Glu/hydantoin racemase